MKSAIFSSAIFAALLQLGAAVKLTNSDYSGIEVGKAFEVTWDEADGAVTLTLRKGDSDDLDTVGVIGEGLSGGSFTWTPSSDLAEENDYALEITDSSGTPNYSPQFTVSGGTAASSSASSSTASSTSTSASSSATSSSMSMTSSSASMTSSSASSTITSSASLTSTTSTKTSSAPSTTSASTTVPDGTGAAMATFVPVLPGVLAAMGAYFL